MVCIVSSFARITLDAPGFAALSNCRGRKPAIAYNPTLVNKPTLSPLGFF